MSMRRRITQTIVLSGTLLLACLCQQGLEGEELRISKKKCVPCSAGTPALKGDDLIVLLQQLQGNWRIVKQHHLERVFYFEDFASALAFTNQVGEVADANGHHPDIILSYDKVTILIWTHKSNGLTESDFVLAAQIEEIAQA